MSRIAPPKGSEDTSEGVTKAAADAEKDTSRDESQRPVQAAGASEADAAGKEDPEELTCETDAFGETAISPSPIISLLAKSGLSRFGHSISESTTSPRGDQALTHGHRRSRHDNSGSSLGPTTPSRLQALCARQIHLSTVILIALIFFLFGSFLRSVQAPADFIVFPKGMMSEEMDQTAAPGPARAWELRRPLTPAERRDVLAHDFVSELRKILGQEDDVPVPEELPWRPESRPDGVAVTQREIKRVLKIKRLFGGWDMIIAFARS